MPGRSTILAVGALLAAFGAVGAARADGYPPFYGYSSYYGGPTPYFTDETDVRQVTSFYEDSFLSSAKRTYYRGGPFFTYRPVGRSLGPVRAERRRIVRAKG